MVKISSQRTPPTANDEQLEEDSYGSSTLLYTSSSSYRHLPASNNIAIDDDSKYNMYYHRNCYHCMMNRNNLGVMLLREKRYIEAANCFCDSVKYINERSEYNNSSISSCSRNCYHHNGYQGTADSTTTKFDSFYWLSEDTWTTNHYEEEEEAAAVDVAPTYATANEEVPTNTSTFLFRNPIVISERPCNSTAGKSRTPLTDETDDANSSSSFFDKGSCLRLSSMSVYNMALTYHLAALDKNDCNYKDHQSSKFRNSNDSKRRRSSNSTTYVFSSSSLSSLLPSSSQPSSSKRRRIIGHSSSSSSSRSSNNHNETMINQEDSNSCIIDDEGNRMNVGKNKYYCYRMCYDDDITTSRRGTARRVAIAIHTNSSPSLTKPASSTETLLGPSTSGNSDSSSGTNSSSGITKSTNDSTRTFLLRQALAYYDMAYRILISNKDCDEIHDSDGGVLISQAMVLLNNMGHIHRLLDDESKATSCFLRLLTTMMYVQLQDEETTSSTSSSISTSSVSSSSSNNLRQRICRWDRFVDNVIDLMIDNVDDDDDKIIGDITNIDGSPRSFTSQSRRRRRRRRRLAKVATAA